MKLFLLSALLLSVSYGFTVTTTTCTSSTECTGDDCNSVTATYNLGCVQVEGVGSGEYTCEGNLFNTTIYTSDDCSGTGQISSVEIDQCVANPIGGSVKVECGSNSAFSLNILVGIMAVFIASLFQ